MTSIDLESYLACRAPSAVPGGFHATMAIATGNTRLTALAVDDRGVIFDSSLEADVTFVFDSAETALAVLTGKEDPIAAFLDGRFRSDGHLPLAFVLLGLFRPGAETAPPP